MTETRYCIICGEPFESDDPEAIFCPEHGRKPSATPEVKPAEGILPPDKSEQDAPVTPPSTIADWQVGDLILDTYEVKGGLGEGGFGKVYRVHHKNWNMDLAVKRALNLDEENKQDFIDEAQHWIDLGLHPHIISCFYVRNIDGFPHTFAELADGGSLDDWIREKQGNLYEGEEQEILARILDIAIQFAWGLGYAHEQGLVHQDVKPQNALMTSEGVLKVTDFGLAKAGRSAEEDEKGEDGEKEKKIIYSRYHCSPEQRMGKPLTLATDIWSWGVSVLEMFNGGITWMGGQIAASALESYLQHAGEEEDIPRMPDAVADLLRECFRDDPQARPKDMLEIEDRLISIYQQELGQPYRRETPKPADLRADSLNNKALSMLDLGKPEQAEVFFEQAIAADSQHVEATYNLGLLRWRTGRMGDVDVLQQLGQIQQDKPEDGNLACALGWVCLESGRFSEALTFFEQAESLGGDPTRGDGIKLARPLAEQGAGGCLRTLEGHKDYVRSVAISPDKRYALSGSGDKTLKLWDLETGVCLRTLEGHTNRVHSVTFSPDGLWALSGSWDNTLKLWDLRQGKCLRTFEGHTEFVESVSISSDGRYVLSGSYDKTLKLWDLAVGNCLRTFEGHTHYVLSVVMSPDGSRALSGSEDKTLKLWDLTGGACLRTYEGHKYSVTSVAFKPDGCLAISGCRDKTLKLWDLERGACLGTFDGHTYGVESIAISPNGRWAISGSQDDTLKLWDLEKGVCLRTFEGHGSRIWSVSISLDGCWALSGSYDETLKLWDLAWVENHRITAPLRYARGVAASEAAQREQTHAKYLAQSRELQLQGQIAEALAYLERARAVQGFERASTTLAVSTSLGSVAQFKGFREGWLTHTLRGHRDLVKSVIFNPDRCWILSGSVDKTLKLWDFHNGDCLHTFEGHSDSVTSVVFSPDGCLALSGSEDNTLKLWDVAVGTCLRTFKGHTSSVNSVAFSQDGQLVLSGSANCILMLWDAATGVCLRTFEANNNGITSTAFSPDGCRALSGGWDNTLKLWDLAKGVCLSTFEGHTQGVNSVAFSPDGGRALSGSWDNTLKLWDLNGGACLQTIEGHTGSVQSIAFSPDGRWALSGSWDNTLKLWDLEGGACLRTFEGHTRWVNSVAFSANGHQALSGSGDKTLKLYDLDWEYEFPGWADWDEGARPYLETFLTLHTPYAGQLPQDSEPSEEEIRLSLTRQGKTTWTEEDFQGFLKQLGQRGYGWLREEGVRRKLTEMAEERG